MSAFVVPASKIPALMEDPENQFEFQLVEDGSTHVLPKLGFFPRKTVKHIAAAVGEKVNSIELFRQLVELHAPDAFEAVDALEEDQAAELADAWFKASEITVGESTASEDS